MKKKILAIILATLMAIPFGAMSLLSASADTVSVPAEPTVKSDAARLYIGFQNKGTGSGENAENYAGCTGWSNEGSIHSKLIDGAYCIIEQKGYVGASVSLDTNAPVLFTALDPADNQNNLSKNADGTLNVTSVSGQIGMFIVYGDSTFTIANEVIFENTALLQRTGTATYNVKGKLVIAESVQVVSTSGTVATPKLNVEEGGYAYLHAVGFSDYTGEGTIVLDTKLVENGTATADMFANFKGKIVDASGKTVDFSAKSSSSDTSADTSADTNNGNTGTSNTGTTDNPNTGDVCLAIVAAMSVSAAVAGAVLTLKKKEN